MSGGTGIPLKNTTSVVRNSNRTSSTSSRSSDTKERDEIIKTLGLHQEARKSVTGKRRIVSVLIVLFLLLAALIVLTREEKPQMRYQTAVVERGDITMVIDATGNLTPTDKVQVGCELSGIIKKVAVDFNDRVQIGQPLASLDDTKFKAAVMESRSALEAAEAKYLQTRASAILKKQNFDRLQRLYKISDGELPSLEKMETAEAEFQRANGEESAAKAAIRQARARLEIDETNLSKTTILSPIRGVVLSRNVDPGQAVAASLQAPVLFTLARDLTQMELQVDVDEADIGLVHEGQKAEFTVGAYNGRVFAASIAQIRFEPRITNGVVTYTSLLNVENPDRVLRPGMTATVKIVAKKIADTIMVPNAALRFTPRQQTDGAANQHGLFKRIIGRVKADDPPAEMKRLKIGHKQVWCLRQGQLTAVSVRTGLTDGVYTAITDGDLEPGMQVAVETIADD
jgi:HlyD family secretion protein